MSVPGAASTQTPPEAGNRSCPPVAVQGVGFEVRTRGLDVCVWGELGASRQQSFQWNVFMSACAPREAEEGVVQEQRGHLGTNWIQGSWRDCPGKSRLGRALSSFWRKVRLGADFIGRGSVEDELQVPGPASQHSRQGLPHTGACFE